MTRTHALMALAVCLALPALGAGQGLGGAAAKEKATPAKTYTRATIASWEKQTPAPGSVFVGRDRQAVASWIIADLQAKTAAAKAELAAAEKALENLQDEARRASVPPGWLR